MADPTLHGLLPLLEESDAFRRLAELLAQGHLAPGEEPMALNLPSAARPFVAAALAEALQRPLFILAARPEQALQFQEQLRYFVREPERIWNFPDPAVLPYERAPWSHDRVQRRIAVLTELSSDGAAPIVVASARALLYPTIPQGQFRAALRHYTVGQRVSLRFLLAALYQAGYLTTNLVLEPGQVAQRGGILDIFPVNQPNPVRLEFWGDDLDSIRAFDPLTQRSLGTLPSVTIPPATEALLPRDPAAIVARLAALDCSGCAAPVQQEFEEQRRQLRDGERFEGIEFFLPYLYDQPGSVLDFLPAESLILVEEWPALELAVDMVEREALQQRDELVARGELPPRYQTALHTWDDLRDFFSQRPPLLLGYGSGDDGEGLGALFSVGPRYGGRLQEAIRTMREARGSATQLLLTRQAERMAELLRDEGVLARVVSDLTEPPVPGTLTLVNGALNEGFQFSAGAPQCALHLITDAELFGWSRAASRRPLRPRRQGSATALVAEINEGDFIVHSEHGIGLYRGLVQREVAGVTREYLELEYAQGDKLYVPVHQADRVARYQGPGDREPNIHRLGTADWDTARRRAKRAVEEIADELLELYAARATVQGHTFGPDTPWQAELEASFPYVETEDQLRAIVEVKADMEQPMPMDRLVIGDVGFGKTEVALRAAFKAVMDGKQVAVLVPTTVLAQQHFTNFSQRLAPYPITVEMLSRFRSHKEQDEIVERLGKGQVDIVVGTHRLLSKDVQFKELGLVVIDEEQRFGVTHKEHLKQLRKAVDVLTLTATPIPRTLHMALTGARDMSTIETPPEERLPVITRVMEWDDVAVRRAILLEIDRGGQVFFVHNRVMSIHAIAQRLGALVPEARFAVAHGQMNEHELEETMVAFAAGQFDVLVCTSIIESGLDLPNVNTIVLDRADIFGLAQLYQLRGRVGRGARRGYAYFVHPRATQLTPEALERLDVMQEATELGAGFRVAMRDLEIRGAGDLLGARQSGNIAAVGFDMFMRLLQQAVRERREALERPSEPTRRARAETMLASGAAVDLPLEAYLPAQFVADDEVRLELYRRMAEAQSLDEAGELESELRDRFGPLPEEAANLLYILRLRLLAGLIGVTQVNVDGDSGRLAVQLPGPGPVRLLEESGLLAGRVAFGRRELFVPRNGSPATWKPDLEAILLTLATEAFAALERQAP